MRARVRSTLCALVAFVIGPLGFETPAHATIYNFDVVEQSRLFRSSRAETYEDFRGMILDHNIRRIVNLEDDPRSVERERQWCDRLFRETNGKVAVYQDRKPVDHYDDPKPHYVQQILESMNDTTSGAVWVHCKAGRDRTGLFVALFRVAHHGWRRGDAYHEWRSTKYNFNERNELHFKPLDRYFRHHALEHTGRARASR